MKTRRGILTLLVFVSMFCSCSDVKQNKQDNIVDKQELKKTLENVNRILIRQEAKMIDDYIEGQDLVFNATGTGLRYAIVNENNGRPIEQGNVVTIEYEILSLEGKQLYSSDKNGNKTFVVGRGGVESGLEEAITKLHENDSAVLIIPSHLAHGLLGDGDRIPIRSTLIYKLKVIENKTND